MYKEESKKYIKREHEQIQMQRRPNKENISLKANYDQRKDKKFTYPFINEKVNTSSCKVSARKQKKESKDEEIERLKKELQEQKQKVKYLQTTIIQQQSLVLKHLEILQKKFYEVTAQKNQLEEQLNHNKVQKHRPVTHSSQFEQWKDKYVKLQEQHKKIKKIAQSLIKMMKKVDGVEGDLHQAWKWVKKIVWEYEGIRSKALDWKAVYDQINEAVDLIQN